MVIGSKTYTWDDTLLITTDLAKHNLRVEHSLDDTEIATFIKAAYQDVEGYLNRVLLNQTINYLVDSDDDEFTFTLSQPESFDSIGDIIGTSTDGTKETATTKTIAFDGYKVTVSNIVFPTITDLASYQMSIAYLPKLLNDCINQAVYLTITNYYENRNSVIVGTVARELPLGVSHIIQKHKYQLI
tara:strand:- start:556 stop:1113 length:558 start_codon:yes stop_codon:yes gene_type:complete